MRSNAEKIIRRNEGEKHSNRINMKNLPKSLTTVTPLSKFLAGTLFILLPFLGFYLGYTYSELTTVIPIEYATIYDKNVTRQNANQMANPASVNCEQKGGTLSILKRPDGGEYGLCNFDDGRSCEEWAMFRNECPIGGVKTTGLNTTEQKYCMWVGGQTSAVSSKCTFKDRSTCDNLALYNGTCQKGESSK
jgi:putative hemolysin